MGNKWRPEGWNKIKADAVGVEEEDTKYVAMEFEAGADAMLEALRKSCNLHFSEWLQQEGVEAFGFKVQPGKWVFIPDEE